MGDPEPPRTIPKDPKEMLDFAVVVVLSRPRPGFDPATLLPDHLDVMIALEKTRRLFLSGPLTTSDGQSGTSGLTIFNVATVAEAERL